MSESLILFAKGVFRSWWLLVGVLPGATGLVLATWFPDDAPRFAAFLNDWGAPLLFLALLIAAFQTFHEYRPKRPPYEDAVRERLEAYFNDALKFANSPTENDDTDYVLFLLDVTDYVQQHMGPTEAFGFSSYCRTHHSDRKAIVEKKLRPLVIRYGNRGDG